MTIEEIVRGDIKELEYEGERISWDELVCVGCPVTEGAIKKLCRDMNRYRKEMLERKERTKKPLQVTKSQLLNWNVIRKSEDGYRASNAYALLTGKYFHYSRTQCAVFAGTERGEFIDKQEYAGPLYEQIEEAYAFVLRNIRRGAKVEGLVRRERHELPPAAIREMIVNAHCHRNFLDTSCVQVALYDDRLEVTSPGGLCYGLTLEEAVSGRSKQRNRVVAEVFNQMGLIEAWGTGLRSICRAAEEYHLPEPEFIEMPGTFRVNLYRNLIAPYDQRSSAEASEKQRRKDAGASEKQRSKGAEASEKQRSKDTEASEKHQRSVGAVTASEKQQGSGRAELNQTQEKILELLLKDAQLSAAKLGEQIGITSRNIEINIRKLKEQGILVRHGSPKSGYWEIVDQRIWQSRLGI